MKVGLIGHRGAGKTTIFNMETAVSRDVRTVIVDGETLVDNGKYLRLDEQELLDKVQAKGEQVWDSVPKWHWTGKNIDEVVPPSFKMK